jgi:hypothetical protein
MKREFLEEVYENLAQTVLNCEKEHISFLCPAVRCSRKKPSKFDFKPRDLSCGNYSHGQLSGRIFCITETGCGFIVQTFWTHCGWKNISRLFHNEYFVPSSDQWTASDAKLHCEFYNDDHTVLMIKNAATARNRFCR